MKLATLINVGNLLVFLWIGDFHFVYNNDHLNVLLTFYLLIIVWIQYLNSVSRVNKEVLIKILIHFFLLIILNNQSFKLQILYLNSTVIVPYLLE